MASRIAASSIASLIRCASFRGAFSPQTRLRYARRMQDELFSDAAPSVPALKPGRARRSAGVQ
ncbi:MAG TPA: hypothetical protein PKZ28_05985, partial [Piscinibacter sp.]|nr:hypothetical protein [Piscinibacter sp.]